MKPIKYVIVTLVLLTITSGAFAQFRVGGGLGFGFDQEAFSLFARAGYDFTENLRTNATFNFYFLENEDTDFLDRDAFDINLDVNYDFANLPTIDLYGLAGLNIYRLSTETVTGDFKNTDLGLNIGVGGLFGVADKIDILSELKYNIGSTEELFFGFGVMFNITGSR
ncbi:MAG: outer membrane beta-barrel protein [Saprospiraceae bacterium]